MARRPAEIKEGNLGVGAVVEGLETVLHTRTVGKVETN